MLRKLTYTVQQLGCTVRAQPEGVSESQDCLNPRINFFIKDRTGVSGTRYNAHCTQTALDIVAISQTAKRKGILEAAAES